jgi:hypothetical protein
MEMQRMREPRPLRAPVPPMLERPLATHGAATWRSTGEQGTKHMSPTAVYRGVGSGRLYLVYVRHPRVRLELVRYDFGSSEAPARDGLVLDRSARRLNAGPVEE